MENKPTVEIHEELSGREGVTEIIVKPGERLHVVVGIQCKYDIIGPARVLVNID